MAAADVELAIEATIASVLNELDGVFSQKEEQSTALKAFLERKDVLAVLLTTFVKV